MRPPPQYSGFEPYQVGIHGISSHRVASEPTFAEVLETVVLKPVEQPALTESGPAATLRCRLDRRLNALPYLS